MYPTPQAHRCPYYHHPHHHGYIDVDHDVDHHVWCCWRAVGVMRYCAVAVQVRWWLLPGVLPWDGEFHCHVDHVDCHVDLSSAPLQAPPWEWVGGPTAYHPRGPPVSWRSLEYLLQAQEVPVLLRVQVVLVHQYAGVGLGGTLVLAAMGHHAVHPACCCYCQHQDFDHYQQQEQHQQQEQMHLHVPCIVHHPPALGPHDDHHTTPHAGPHLPPPPPQNRG